MVVLPQQQVPDFWLTVPRFTVWALLLMSAPVAGVIEEAAFRGYMQGPIERRYGPAVAILITGTMFAVARLDFTLVLWPYYVAVAAIYGMVAYLTNSIWPAIVLHTGGNMYSNFDLWLHGQAEWQASTAAADLVWTTGVDEAFVRSAVALLVVTVAVAWAYARLAGAAREAVRLHVVVPSTV
jgi:membrane protease YdiL (CAAX protease family)